MRRQLKQPLTMTLDEIQQGFDVIKTILMDCQQAFAASKGQQGAAAAAGQPPATGAPNQAQMSTANFEAQQAVPGDKAQQQRAGAKGQNAQAQVPVTTAAPQAAQPSFQLGAISPHGQPKYMNAPKDMNLHIPPKKKAKMNNQAKQQGPQAGTAAAAEAKKQEPKPPTKPVFHCTEPDCEMAATGFPTEEARQAHIQTEHVQPRENPLKFFQENLAATLGVDLEGNALDGNLSQNTPQMGAVAMSATQSRQGQTPASFTPTPMSRGLSMNRSASGAGAKQQAKAGAKDVKAEAAKANTAIKEAPKPPADGFAASTIDPQALFADMPGFTSNPAGLFSDPAVLQALTPNDTPDSKDSGPTEATGEPPEPWGGDLDANWQPFGDGFMMLGAPEVGDEAVDEWDRAVLLDAVGSGVADVNWDEVNVDFGKPFTMDAGLYSMDPTSSA